MALATTSLDFPNNFLSQKVDVSASQLPSLPSTLALAVNAIPWILAANAFRATVHQDNLVCIPVNIRMPYHPWKGFALQQLWLSSRGKLAMKKNYLARCLAKIVCECCITTKCCSCLASPSTKYVHFHHFLQQCKNIQLANQNKWCKLEVITRMIQLYSPYQLGPDP